MESKPCRRIGDFSRGTLLRSAVPSVASLYFAACSFQFQEDKKVPAPPIGRVDVQMPPPVATLTPQEERMKTLEQQVTEVAFNHMLYLLSTSQRVSSNDFTETLESRILTRSGLFLAQGETNQTVVRWTHSQFDREGKTLRRVLGEMEMENIRVRNIYNRSDIHIPPIWIDGVGYRRLQEESVARFDVNFIFENQVRTIILDRSDSWIDNEEGLEEIRQFLLGRQKFVRFKSNVFPVIVEVSHNGSYRISPPGILDYPLPEFRQLRNPE